MTSIFSRPTLQNKDFSKLNSVFLGSRHVYSRCLYTFIDSYVHRADKVTKHLVYTLHTIGLKKSHYILGGLRP